MWEEWPSLKASLESGFLDDQKPGGKVLVIAVATLLVLLVFVVAVLMVGVSIFVATHRHTQEHTAASGDFFSSVIS